MMLARNKAIGGAIGVLVLLNLWQWWPQDQSGPGSRVIDSGIVRPGDFTLPGIAVSESNPVPNRNPFSRVTDVKKIASRNEKRKTTTARAAMKKRAPNPAEDFRQFQLVGVVFRDNQGEAYIMNSGEPITAKAGQQIDNRYRVDKVLADAVVLREIKKGTTWTIRLTGGVQ